MKKGLVIADSGPIFSLALIGQLDILNLLFRDIKIPVAVWEEITKNPNAEFYREIKLFFKSRIHSIIGFNDLTFIMDYGESESVILYKELNSDYLLIDDKKARRIAENFDINCIGTLGVLSTAKSRGIVDELRPLFLKFLENKRFYSKSILNTVLELHKEDKI